MEVCNEFQSPFHLRIILKTVLKDFIEHEKNMQLIPFKELHSKLDINKAAASFEVIAKFSANPIDIRAIFSNLHVLPVLTAVSTVCFINHVQAQTALPPTPLTRVSAILGATAWGLLKSSES